LIYKPSAGPYNSLGNIAGTCTGPAPDSQTAQGGKQRMECPICGCRRFYAKDPEDAYETYEFECRGDDVFFDSESEADIEITPETETFCDRCSWHGKLKTLREGRG
jgi:hypothetical protein